VTAKSICRKPVSTPGKGTRTPARSAPVCLRGCSSWSPAAGQMWGGGAPRTGTHRRCSVLFEWRSQHMIAAITMSHAPSVAA
jgi:hypothetical protein